MNRLNRTDDVIQENKNLPTSAKKGLDSFRRTQLGLGWWGLLLLGGGWLHNSYASPQAWGINTLLLIWLGLSLLGFVGSYWLQPTLLNSGMLFIWLGAVLVGLGLTWLIIFPFNNDWREYVSALWHAVFGVGYLITGYYMDRRLGVLAAWEAFVALVMLLIAEEVWIAPDLITKNFGLTLGLSSGLPLILAALPIWKKN